MKKVLIESQYLYQYQYPEKGVTVGGTQRYAIESAKSYLSFMAFSKEGLKSQLRYEKYSEKDAQYAVDHCGADWYEQAYKCAKGYMEDNSLSRSELIDQLIYEGYSPEQAIYGVNRVFR